MNDMAYAAHRIALEADLRRECSEEGFKFYRDLPAEIQYVVEEWIDLRLCITQSSIQRHSSYGLKHVLQADTGIYLTNCQFKAAMRFCGWIPCKKDCIRDNDPNMVNWIFQCRIVKDPASRDCPWISVRSDLLNKLKDIDLNHFQWED